MLKRIARDATKADLAAVEALLKERTEEEDPVGYLQFALRADELTKRLEEIEETPSTNAEVGLFFGGRPVVGSYGIQAEFGAKAISEFQTLVSNAYASMDGNLGARGPVRHRERTQLFLTNVVRGSFGFILEQMGDQKLIDSEIKQALLGAVDLIFKVASPDQETFEGIIEEVDGRILSSLRSFFKVLDEAGATLRIVEDRREYTLQRADVELARKRTEAVTLQEIENNFVGTIYVLPASRRFELHDQDGSILKGPISRHCLEEILDANGEVVAGLIGSRRHVRLRVREIQTRGYDPHKSYILLAVGEMT